MRSLRCSDDMDGRDATTDQSELSISECNKDNNKIYYNSQKQIETEEYR